MAYTIIKTNGAVLTTIADGTVNTTSSSLQLPGRNYAGYGVVMDTNLVHLLENFSDSVVPPNPIRGQLWYNTTTQALYVCPSDGETNINNWFKILSNNDDLVTFFNLTLSGNLIANNASITSNLVSNNITANTLTVNANANLLGTSVISTATMNTITAGSTTGNLNGNWTVSGNLSASNVKTNNYLYANGDPISFVNIAGSNTQIQFNNNGVFGASSNFVFNTSTNVLTVTGNVNATQFIGNGLGLTNSNAANLTGTIPTSIQSNITQLGTLSSLTVTGTASAGNVTASGTVTGSKLTGSLTTASQPNVTSLGTLTNLISNGVVNFTNTSNVSLGSVGNVHISGGTSGYVLSTDGSGGLSFVSPGSLQTTPAGSNTQLQFNNNGVLGASANLTFNTSTNVLAVTGNISATNASLGNAATANFFVGSGYTLANIRGSNIVGQAPNAVVSGTVYSNAQPNITSVGTLTSLSVSGNITSSNADLGNLVVANFFSGDGGLLSNLQIANASVANANYALTAGSANTANVATTANVSNVANNASKLNITQNNSAVNITFVGYTGTISGASENKINYSGPSWEAATNTINSNITGSASLAGSVTTAAQPNITSVGTLTSITTSGTITAANASLGNTATAAYFVGNGFRLTNINGSNVSGTVGNATIAGTVTTNAQPNITSVGTLTSLVISNDLTVGGNTTTTNNILAAGNISTAGNITIAGNISAANITISNMFATYNVTAVGNVSASYFVGNGSKLSNINGSNITGSIANATYANIAGTVYSVSGSNVVGAVANAVHSSYAIALEPGIQLQVDQGGTGTPSLPLNQVLLGNGTSAIKSVSPGTSGNVLTSNGTVWNSLAPATIGVGQTWQSFSSPTRQTDSSFTWSTITNKYTNSTGKPIMVSVGRYGGNGYATKVWVDGVAVLSAQVDQYGGAESMGAIIVPNGSQYAVSVSNGVWCNYWVELR